MNNTKLWICGYARISVDVEDENDKNVSIENQKDIIEHYVHEHFPGSSLDIYADRDRSGYTFAEREQYQIIRGKLLAHEYDILVVKDLSRFSRRNSLGLVEIETLLDAGIRIIAINDNIDYPTNDDWFKIQVFFIFNEQLVTETSKKVRNVIMRRQADGRWICSVPYGYHITDSKAMTFEVDEPAAEIVRKIFELYNSGWGYKRIANWLTDQHYPTPRENEIAWKYSKGEDTRLKSRDVWSIATVQGILDNDFYVGTLRQGKYTRRKINGADIKKEISEQIVFENHHEAILDAHTFAITRELRTQRTRSNYRGVKKHENAYSGLLFCGDCGSPMFSMSRSDLSPAYVCGAYHRRGTKACTSHHTRVDTLDETIKGYIREIRDNSASMIDYLENAIKGEEPTPTVKKNVLLSLKERLREAEDELAATTMQKVRDCMRHPENRDEIESTFDRIEADLRRQITGIKNQIQMTNDQSKAIEQVKKKAKTVLEIFDSILDAKTLTHEELSLVVEKIIVYNNKRIYVRLRSDVAELLCCGSMDELPDDAVLIQPPLTELSSNS